MLFINKRHKEPNKKKLFLYTSKQKSRAKHKGIPICLSALAPAGGMPELGPTPGPWKKKLCNAIYY